MARKIKERATVRYGKISRVLDFLRTEPHERANRSPETIARALALIGAGGQDMPPDLSENLDEYLYGSKK